MNFRKSFKILAAIVFCVLALGIFIWFDGQYAVPVLMYHNIGTDARGRNNTVSLESFQKQLDYLKRNNYRVVTLDEICGAMVSQRRLPRKTVAITFDDGNDNNFVNAFPALVERGMTATFFVPAGQIAHPGTMTWEQLALMRDQGMRIGSHGMSHAYLPEVSLQQQRFEINESKKVLAERLKVRVDYYAYPVGGLTQTVKELVRDAGYQAAFTTNRGVSKLRDDVYEIRRIKMSSADVNPVVIWGKLNGYYNFYRTIKNPY